MLTDFQNAFILTLVSEFVTKSSRKIPRLDPKRVATLHCETPGTVLTHNRPRIHAVHSILYTGRADVSGKTREGSFLFQRLSVLIQRFKAVLLHYCFVDDVAGHSS